MNTTHFSQMLNNQWATDECAQGEYCQLTQDRLTIYDQGDQETLGACPRVTVFNGSTAIVETFPGYEAIWHTQSKEPEQGLAIYLSQMGVYAVKPLECS